MLAHGLFGRIQQRQDLLGHGQQLARGRREGHVLGVALEQLHPEPGFQLADGAAQRRLGHVQLLGRLAEVQASGDGDKDLQRMAVEFSHVFSLYQKGITFLDIPPVRGAG